MADCGLIFEPADLSLERVRVNATVARPDRLPDGYDRIFKSYVFGPSGFWTMALLRCAAKFDFFLSLDCARVEGVGEQSEERKGSSFAIWQPWP